MLINASSGCVAPQCGQVLPSQATPRNENSPKRPSPNACSPCRRSSHEIGFSPSGSRTGASSPDIGGMDMDDGDGPSTLTSIRRNPVGIDNGNRLPTFTPGNPYCNLDAKQNGVSQMSSPRGSTMAISSAEVSSNKSPRQGRQRQPAMTDVAGLENDFLDLDFGDSPSSISHQLGALVPMCEPHGDSDDDIAMEMTPAEQCNARSATTICTRLPLSGVSVNHSRLKDDQSLCGSSSTTLTDLRNGSYSSDR